MPLPLRLHGKWLHGKWEKVLNVWGGKSENHRRRNGRCLLIQVTRLNGVVFFINPHQIEYIESNPDTTLVMLSDKRIVVKESVDELRRRIVEYRRLIGAFKNEE
jgi:flagellar protein FlbD